jgi:hypothetical protein
MVRNKGPLLNGPVSLIIILMSSKGAAMQPPDQPIPADSTESRAEDFVTCCSHISMTINKNKSYKSQKKIEI